jgi:hypothetical protein
VRGVRRIADLALIGFFSAFLLLVPRAQAKERRREPEFARGRYARLFGGVELGRGLRLNNPYRLETVLGDDAESLSLTATYLDLSVGAAFGPPDGLQHGGALHASFALHGIPQEVLTPSYVAMTRWTPFRFHGRVGTPIVLEPDANVGAEIAAGAAWLLSAGLGVGLELCASMFYGAATYDRTTTAIPIISLQGGLALDYEILP